MATVIYRNSYAYDLSIDIIKDGDLFDSDVINQSIMSILSTSKGERIFNLDFGSFLPSLLFDSINTDYADEVLNTILIAIEQWEDRITILQNDVEMEILLDQNSIILTIPYIINKNSVKSFFQRKIIF